MSNDDRTIHLLWPTIRPAKMKTTHAHWIRTADDPARIHTRIAVNTTEHKQQLKDHGDVLVTGTEQLGPAMAVFKLGRTTECRPRDIIVVASDDFYSPPKWDRWLLGRLKDYDGGILVKDGIQRFNIMTLPIMTGSTLAALNRIIYHPSYVWECADVELCDNLMAMDRLRNERRISPLFEHRHWFARKRTQDSHDKYGRANSNRDRQNYLRRRQWPLQRRLQA